MKYTVANICNTYDEYSLPYSLTISSYSFNLVDETAPLVLTVVAVAVPTDADEAFVEAGWLTTVELMDAGVDEPSVVAEEEVVACTCCCVTDVAAVGAAFTSGLADVKPTPPFMQSAMRVDSASPYLQLV